MSNGYKIFEAISSIDDSIIADAMNAERRAVSRAGVISAVTAVFAAAIIVPAVIIASRKPDTPPAGAVSAVSDTAPTTQGDTDKTKTPVEYVPKHEDITIEEIRKTEPYSELLPAKLLKNSVQTEGVRGLYDELIMEKDAVVYPNYYARFYIDPEGVIYEEMKDPVTQLGISVDQTSKMRSYQITLSSLSYYPDRFHYVTDLKNKEEYDISFHLDPVPEGVIPVEFTKENESWQRLYAAEQALFLPEQVTIETIKARIMEKGAFCMYIAYGDYFVEYLLWIGPYDDGTYARPTAEEIYEMITSAPAFNK